MSTFDYVIVGAGSAGCVLAARLSEDPEVTVAVVEAGGPDDAEAVHVPAAFGSLFKSDVDWSLESDPEPVVNNRRFYLPRGRMLGGSSSLNAMIYIRGHRSDYDSWAANGADGWGYYDVLPYFRRSEDNERGESSFHGVGGPLAVSDSRSRHSLASAFLDSAEQAGHAPVVDFNGAEQEGVGFYQVTQRDGMRCSCATAFLHPAMTRPNLTVLTNTRALNVVIEGTHAVGVRVHSSDGSDGVIRADREVILSAGAYESPKLLMLSGVGSPEVLRPLEIAVRQALPVGQGLQDHLLTLTNYLSGTESLMTALSPSNMELLKTEGRGPLTSNIAEAGGFARTRSEIVAPDVQFVMAPVLYYDEGLGPVTQHGYAIGISAIAPTSRGHVALRSADPQDSPRIVHNYLASTADRESQMRGVQLALDIAAQGLLAKQSTAFDVPDSAADADILAFIRRSSMTFYHPTSSCAIGTVVDSDLKVFGLDNLRIVDASVMPAVPRGNTNAPTIMIAERAADLIKGTTMSRPDQFDETVA